MSIIVFDTEVYRDYFLAAFKDTTSGKVRFFEMYDGHPLDRDGLKRALQSRHTFVSFNGINFDLPVLFTAIQCGDCAKVKDVCDDIIRRNKKHWQVIRERKIATFEINHIDLIEVAPGVATSLKLFGGRMHAPKLQDLPIAPDASISQDQRELMRTYCVNDLDTTAMLYHRLAPQIALREQMGGEYGEELRSKSDAQIAESVIGHQLREMSITPTKPVIPPGTAFKYNIPCFVSFRTEQLRDVLDIVRGADFVVADTGSIKMPKELNSLSIAIGNSVYRMGIGGLHSSEERQTIFPSEDELLLDIDAASMYPTIILEQGLYPKHLTSKFLSMYKAIVDRRIAAKHSGDKVVADSLKITVNGSFGKLGSKYSFLYSPDLLIQTTLSGQLCLLMLIERIEAGVGRVVSANTDGIVILVKKALYRELLNVVSEWEFETGFTMEETRYRSIHSESVNNYIAVKPSGETKGKGIYADSGLMKNPANTICSKAVKAFLSSGVSIDETIRGCVDVREFVTVRTVNGGAEWCGEYVGKTVRWYYTTSNGAPMTYIKNGNKVPKSDGCKPLQNLPDAFPSDVDFDWYIAEAEKMLTNLGVK